MRRSSGDGIDVVLWRFAVFAALVALIVIFTSCHAGGKSLTFGANVARDPFSGEFVPSIGGTVVPHLKFDEEQGARFFQRRNGDIEQIAQMRAQLTSSMDAQREAEEASRAVQAQLEAVTTRADRAEDLAKAEWWERILDRIFTTDINANQLGALALLAVVAVVVVRRRRKAGSKARGS